MTCDSVPQYEEVEWLLGDTSVLASQAGLLSLPLVTEADSGLYTCSASNRHGSVTRTVSLTVQVRPQTWLAVGGGLVVCSEIFYFNFQSLMKYLVFLKYCN